LNEAYLKLVGADLQWEDRPHFLCIASRTMRQVLVDHAKGRQRVKRGAGALRVDLDEIDLADARHDPTIIEVDEALMRLAKQDERRAKLIELLYFGGLTYKEAAQALNISTVTVHRDVKFAKAWLREAMGS
jgi:RNA polymerase sigma factor (TIGR02999 family)